MTLAEYCDRHIRCRGCQFKFNECKKHKNESTEQFAIRMAMLIEVLYETRL